MILRIKPKLQKRIFIDGLLFLLGFYCLLISVPAQTKIAFIITEKNSRSADFAEKLKDSFSKDAKVLDISLSEAAFRAQNLDKPFNLSLSEAKNVGAAIGCDYFLLIKAENLRRTSLSKGDFYESYAVIFTVGSRAGKLVFWKLGSFEAETAEDADKKLFASVESLATEISGKLKIAEKSEFEKRTEPKFEKLPEEDSTSAKNFRPPLPYKRFRPEYTALANLYGVEATVDAEFDVDKNGKILKIEIVRWAGFGLDEAVARNIEKMNWRPAERNGKFIPLSILLRYNFKKIDPE